MNVRQTVLAKTALAAFFDELQKLAADGAGYYARKAQARAAAPAPTAAPLGGVTKMTTEKPVGGLQQMASKLVPPKPTTPKAGGETTGQMVAGIKAHPQTSPTPRETRPGAGGVKELAMNKGPGM